MTSDFLLCIKNNSLSVAQYRTFLYSLHELSFLSQNYGYYVGFLRFLHDGLGQPVSVVGLF